MIYIKMTSTTSILEILQGQLYLPTIYKGDKELEINVGDFQINGVLDITGYEVPEDFEFNIPASYEVVKQSFTALNLYDEEGEEIELSKSDVDVIDAWFQQIKLDVWLK